MIFKQQITRILFYSTINVLSTNLIAMQQTSALATAVAAVESKVDSPDHQEFMQQLGNKQFHNALEKWHSVAGGGHYSRIKYLPWLDELLEKLNAVWQDNGKNMSRTDQDMLNKVFDIFKDVNKNEKIDSWTECFATPEKFTQDDLRLQHFALEDKVTNLGRILYFLEKKAKSKNLSVNFQKYEKLYEGDFSCLGHGMQFPEVKKLAAVDEAIDMLMGFSRWLDSTKPLESGTVCASEQKVPYTVKSDEKCDEEIRVLEARIYILKIEKQRGQLSRLVSLIKELSCQKGIFVNCGDYEKLLETPCEELPHRQKVFMPQLLGAAIINAMQDIENLNIVTPGNK